MREGPFPVSARGDVPAPRLSGPVLLAGILLPPIVAVLPVLALMVAFPTSNTAPTIGFGFMGVCCLVALPLDLYLGIRVIQGRDAVSGGSVVGGILLGLAFAGLQALIGGFVFFAGCSCALATGGIR